MFYTQRLMLRNIDPEADTKLLLQWMNGTQEGIELGPPGPSLPKSRANGKKAIEQLADKEDKLPFFMVCEKPNPESMPKNLDVNDDYFVEGGSARYPAIGLLSIGNTRGYSSLNRCVTLGIILDGGHRDKGLGTELMTWALSFVFGNLGMHRVEVGTDSTNERALHLYEKVGFVREGQRRKCALRNGEWADIIDLGMLEKEWGAKQNQATDRMWESTVGRPLSGSKSRS